jgi:hypothetical protein
MSISSITSASRQASVARLQPLMAKFGELLRGHAVFREVFGLI